MRSSAIRCRLDMNILKALKRSSLGLDLYLWLTYRTFSLKRAATTPLGSVFTVSLEWIQLKRAIESPSTTSARTACGS